MPSSAEPSTQLNQHLPYRLSQLVQMSYYPTCHSTNLVLKQQLQTIDTVIKSTPIRVCISDTQTSGKGQHGRSWHSPYGNLYYSIYLPYNPLVASHQLERLPLLVAYHLLQIPACQRVLALPSHQLTKHLSTALSVPVTATQVGIKWANDVGVLYHYQSIQDCPPTKQIGFAKLAGILIEPQAYGVIIGIGLNCQPITQSAMINTDKHFVQRPISLQQLGIDSDNLALAVALTIRLCDYLYTDTAMTPVIAPNSYGNAPAHNGVALSDLQAVNVLRDYRVQICTDYQMPNASVIGTVIGFYRNGSLALLPDGSDKVRPIYNGRVIAIYPR